MYLLSSLHQWSRQSLHGVMPLASIISLQTLENALHVWGYPAVTLFVMIESSGIPFPGETMLLLASFLAAIDHQLQIPLVIACAALGAIVGDNIGYIVGLKGGRPFVERFGRYVFLKPEHLDRAERFFTKHGNKTVFFGRFIAVLRAWAAFLAGVNRMHWRTFVLYNAAGGILWATIFGTLGYLAGRVFHDNFALVERLAGTLSWILGGLIVVAVIVFLVVRRLRSQKASPTSDASPDKDAASKNRQETREGHDGTPAGSENRDALESPNGADQRHEEASADRQGDEQTTRSNEAP